MAQGHAICPKTVHQCLKTRHFAIDLYVNAVSNALYEVPSSSTDSLHLVEFHGGALRVRQKYTTTETDPCRVDESSQPVDFDAVTKNAQEQGVDLKDIMIVYDGLTDHELHVITEFDLLVSHQENCVLARFPSEGKALFPHKAKSVHYLGA